jgi:hypothetical protein
MPTTTELAAKYLSLAAARTTLKLSGASPSRNRDFTCVAAPAGSEARIIDSLMNAWFRLHAEGYGFAAIAWSAILF